MYTPSFRQKICFVNENLIAFTETQEFAILFPTISILLSSILLLASVSSTLTAAVPIEKSIANYGFDMHAILF